MANGMPRAGSFEVFIRQQWCPVSVTLNEESLTLTLTENPDQANATNGSVDAGHGLANGNSEIPESITGQKRYVKVRNLAIRKLFRDISRSSLRF